MKKAHSLLWRGRFAGLPVTRMLLIIAALVVLSIGSIITTHAYADTTTQSTDGRVITLYDRGVERSFITNASTIGDALKEAGVEIDARDRVEPALDETLVANEYAVNVYRARPLLVIDGVTRHVVMTAAQVPEQIAKDASLTLHDEDITKLEQSDNLLADGAAERFIVTRAVSFEFTLYGETFTARTQAKTVGDMLAQKNITLGKNDRVSLPLTAPITSGMSVQVWREGTQTVTRDEEVDFEVDKIQDANRPVGYREVKTPGEKGVRTVTYEVFIRDGKEVARKEIASVEKKASVKQVEIIGSKSPFIPYTGGGTKTEWLAASSIPRDMWGYADFMVTKESGWNPNIINRSSGACGLAQALPCSKLGPNWNNPVVALNWMNNYVNDRYYDGSPYARGLCSGIAGSWQCAYIFWQKNRWY